MKQEVDVIALHKKDNTIIPLRIRLIDEEGVVREFTIKQYRFIENKDGQSLPDGMYINSRMYAFECYIEVAGMRRLVRLYYKPDKHYGGWTMTDIGR